MCAFNSVLWLKLSVVASVALLGGCLTSAPSIGGGSATPVTGAAGGATSTGGNGKLERCPETLGTIRIEENTNASWYNHYYSQYRLGDRKSVV